MDLSHSLTRIAKALQFTLEYENGEIQGSTKARVSFTETLSAEFEISAVKLFAGEQVGVLVDVLGDLSMLVCNNKTMEHDSVTVFLLDTDKVSSKDQTPADLILPRMNLKEVIDAVGSMVVASFLWKDQKWVPLKLKL